MYIRRTQTRNTLSGESYFTFRLVRSERVGGKVKQLTLLNLGRHFEVDALQWPILCARIEELLGGQASLVLIDCPASLERHAQRLVAQLVARGKGASTPSVPTAPAAGDGKTDKGRTDKEQTGDLQTVDVDSMELVRPRSVGVEAAALWAMQQVDFQGVLRELGFSGPQRALALGSIIGRMALPASELATHAWLTQQSGLGELLDVDFEAVGLSSLYRVSDRLLASRAVLETTLFDRVQDLFGLSTTVTLYDLTNTYFEGDMQANPKAQRGHSKEKRSDCPLVTLGLVLDGSGFVRRSEVFDGNVAEGHTLETMLTGLNAPDGALVVMDRGIATEKNLAWLRAQGYRYLVVSRERGRRFDPEQAITLDNASGERVHLEKILADDGHEVRLYCHSEQRAKKEEAINERFAWRFESALDKLAEGLGKPRTNKRLDQLWERIGRLKAKSHGVCRHYEIALQADETGLNAVALTYQRQPLAGSMLTHPGVYCLRSSETDWDAEKLWRTYITLTDLEAVFRSLKSELGLRPVYHHKQERADAHLFITVLAYQFVQIIRRHLREKGIHASWRTLRQWLGNQVRITAVFQRPDGHALHVRKASRPEGEHLAICQALGIDTQPGGINKLLH
jgi:transposase